MIIGKQALLGPLPDRKVPLLRLEDLSQEADPLPHTFLNHHVDPQQLAYLLYTSASTGVPKAVGMSHHSFLDFTLWAGTCFDHEELSSLLFATSLNFDLTVFEIFATFAHGGCLIVVDSLFSLPFSSLRHMVTLINNVPTLFGALLSNHPIFS